MQSGLRRAAAGLGAARLCPCLAAVSVAAPASPGTGSVGDVRSLSTRNPAWNDLARQGPGPAAVLQHRTLWGFGSGSAAKKALEDSRPDEKVAVETSLDDGFQVPPPGAVGAEGTSGVPLEQGLSASDGSSLQDFGAAAAGSAAVTAGAAAPAAAGTIDPENRALLCEYAWEAARDGAWYTTEAAMWFFDTLHSSAGLPWWGAFVAGTLALRFVLAPVTVRQMANQAKMQKAQPELEALRNKLQEMAQKGQRVNEDTTNLVNKLREEQKAIFKKHGLPPPSVQFGVAGLNILGFASFFSATRRLCSSEHPDIVEGGVEIWPVSAQDLTSIDPTGVLTGSTVVLNWIAIELMLRDQAKLQALSPQPSSFPPEAMLWIARGAIGMSAFWISDFPAGVLLTLLTNGVFQLTQSLALKPAFVRRAVGLPLLPHQLGVSSEELRTGAVSAKGAGEGAARAAAAETLQRAGGIEGLKSTHQVLRGGKPVAVGAGAKGRPRSKRS
ncbi:unnamed protein product [Pedinophyceae sp. YPF-701]|nr:unnamed protein product [Pedinophyceae sp. YPF-701]